MWKVDGPLVQVECGAAVVVAYTAKDERGIIGRLLNEGAPEGGSLLVPRTIEMRKKLKEKGIYLPTVSYSYSDELEKNGYRIYFGIECFELNIKNTDLMDALGQLAETWQIPEVTAEYVQSLFLACLECIRQKDYNRAAVLSSRTYYWACLLDMKEIAVNAVINLSGICLINNNISAAYTYGQRAVAMAENEDNYNPYLKYYAHCCLANMSWIRGRGPDAVALFQRALQDIQYLEEPELTVQTMWSIATAYIRLEEYDRARSTLNELYGYVCTNGLYTEETARNMQEYYMLASEGQIEQLKQKSYEMENWIRQITVRRDIAEKQDIGKGFLRQIVKECMGLVVREVFGNLCGFDYTSSLNISYIRSIVKNYGNVGNIAAINIGEMKAEIKT